MSTATLEKSTAKLESESIPLGALPNGTAVSGKNVKTPSAKQPEPAEDTEGNKKLTRDEFEKLIKLEKVVETGFVAGMAAGAALVTIKDERLYREQFGTFEEYLLERWGYSRAHGYRLIDAAETVKTLSPIGDKGLPKLETHVRPLISLDKSQRQAAWAKACEIAANGEMKARFVEEAVAEIQEVEPGKATSKANRRKRLEKSATQGMKEVAVGVEQLEKVLEKQAPDLKKLRKIVGKLRDAIEKHCPQAIDAKEVADA